MIKITNDKIEQFLEEVWDNLLFQNMEAILWNDGECDIRQQGSTCQWEKEIIFKLPLSFEYWCDSYVMNDNNTLDQDMKEDFMRDIADQIDEEISNLNSNDTYSN